MKRIGITFLALFAVAILLADTSELSKWKLFTELDGLPYITGGYYGSVGLAKQHIRLRVVHAMMNIPSFSTPKGFDNYENRTWTLLADYCPSENGYTKGVWIGSGMEYWQNKLRNKEDHTTKEFNLAIYTLGGGYIIPISGHLFINPWVASHVPLTSKREYIIGNKTAKLPAIYAEGSLKLGWRF